MSRLHALSSPNLIDDFWEKSRFVTQVSSTFWNIKGRLTIEDRKKKRVFQEKGAHLYGTFYNTWIWEKNQGRLLLWKARPSSKLPIFLGEFSSGGKDGLVMLFPHLCGKDTYHGSIALFTNGFYFNWSICCGNTGQKSRVSYRYT